MDFVALFVGICIGAFVGFVIAWMWATSIAKEKSSAAYATEAELKGLLAQQAKNYLDTSRETIQSVERQLATLRNSVTEYENTLTMQTEDSPNSTYFGEHASLFLRNTEADKHNPLITENSDNQPRDFANNGSGLFMGSQANETLDQKEKSTK